jgi:hypothetical protein
VITGLGIPQGASGAEPPEHTYSTRRRTALIFTGTGTAGAYHAGVLRALQEAGIKIDLVGGRGVGAASALFAAIDGGARLWDAAGVWKDPSARYVYGWRRTLRLAGYALALAALLLALPLVLLVVAVVVGLTGMLATLIGLGEWGSALTATYTRWIDTLFAPAAIPTVIPRLVVFAVILAFAIVAINASAAYVRQRARRRSRPGAFWRLLGSPLTADALVTRVVSELWSLIRGAAPLAAPSRKELARRYVELLQENLGQPGFRELLVTVHDLDARRDLVFALLGQEQRSAFFASSVDEPEARHFEAFDLAGVSRDHAMDALAAALAVPLATDAHLTTFSPEGPWRGETHRLCDRPEGLARLIEEAAHAGAEQVIIIAPSASGAKPHELSGGRSDFRGRAGEHLAGFEAAALRDALAGPARVFAASFVIRPAHLPLTPLDFAGVYDERSDRMQTLGEIVDRGYEDAYRQFIEPIVGAGAEEAEPVQHANGGQPSAVRL